MYDYNDYRNTIETVRNATDSRSLRSALRGFLCESAMTWWHELEENQRKAIILLDFDPSVVTTMVFFGSDWGFGNSYTDVLDLILNKAELLATSEAQDKWDYDIREIARHACMQAQAEQAAREKAVAVAQELGMVTGLSALEDLLIKNSGKVCDNRKYKENLAKKMRKAFLSDALRYVKLHHNDQPAKEEDE